MKLKKKYKTILILAVCLILLLGLFIIIRKISRVNVGKIVNGKAEYIDRIASVTSNKENNIITIEFKNEQELIDNCIITSKLYTDFKKDNKKYNVSLKDYLKQDNISDKEKYNINKSLQMKLVTEETNYIEYFALTCGFKNKKELLKYTEATLELTKKEKTN